MAKAKTTSVEVECGNGNCSKIVSVQQKDLKSSKTGRFFCSHHCSATVSNTLRPRKYEPTRCLQAGCHEVVYEGKKYCSIACAHRSTQKTKEELQADVVEQIQKFYEQHGRIPVKREMQGPYATARRGFGTWNKAIAAAGFTPNPVMFARRYRAKDGHICDSFTEKCIDDWLYERGIPHELHTPYPSQLKLRSDFVVNGWFIEFFGLEGEHERYTATAIRKRELAEQWEVPLISVYPRDVFPVSKLDEILAPLLNQ